jgi:hypothetical protein
MHWPPIVELRQYTLHPGQRDVLIAMFEEHFVEGQEAAGISVLGTFHDLDDEKKLVWLRGFSNMDQRAESLAAFYYGSVWKAHRDVANATMVDSDDVLLLNPLVSNAATAAVTEIVLLPLSQPAGSGLVAALGKLVPEGATLGVLATSDAENSFPALPVRNERFLVWMVGSGDRNATDGFQAAATLPGVSGPPQVIRLNELCLRDRPGRAAVLHPH